VRFAGPIECTVSRNDARMQEGEALEAWVKAQERVAEPADAVRQASAQVPAKAERTAAAEETPGVRTLRDVLLADLAARLSVPAEQLVLSFEPQAEAVINLPEAQFKFNVQPRRARDLGEVAWDVTITGPAAGSRKAEVRGTARAWQNQVVLARPVSRRQVIQVADLARRRTMVGQLPDAALLKPEQIVGQMAARDLKPGTVMTAPMVEAVPLAKTGQFVTVTLARGNVRIKSVAKALEGGGYGQTIRVKNEVTKEIYQVMLTGPQEASMAPADSSAPADADKGVASAMD
jgi:flagella basal body P-ring formation protein FlgA